MGPFLRSKNKTNKIMLHLLIALIPIIIFTVYKNGYIPYSHGKISFIHMFYPILFIAVGVLTSFVTEAIYAVITKKKDYIRNSYSIFPGLFLALILPLHAPMYVLVIGACVASISKIIFGGFGKNIFNPALIGYIFVVAVYASVFTTTNYMNAYEIDTISSATPLTNASLISGIGSYETLVKPYGNLFDFFIGTVPGSLAETSALLCLIAFIYLSITGTIKWRIPLVYIGTVFISTYAIGGLLGQGLYYPLFQVLSGGLMFGAVFMATDPVTSAVTPIGQILQGLFLGILTVILRFLGVEGVATSILAMNMFVFILDKIGSKSRFNFLKSLGWFLLSWLIVIIMSFSIASSKRTDGNKDPNFSIISKDQNGNQTTYVVTQKGYGGSIKGEIVIENDKIKTFTILSNHETKDRYQMVVDNDYLSKLIIEQDNIDSVDTISGATVTSTALKKMVINVMEDYK